jgi:hypothetical protein
VPAQIIVAWREHRYALVTSTKQLLELDDNAGRTTQVPCYRRLIDGCDASSAYNNGWIVWFEGG